jgi:DNA (cytosine-5)-methyltransferase 1
MIQIDIDEVEAHEIPAHDLLCAGFSCKPFSQAGLRRGFLDAEFGGCFAHVL